MHEKKERCIVEARDTGGRGLAINRLLVEFGLAKDIGEANSLIRAGSVDIDNTKVRDILHLLPKGTYSVRIGGSLVAEATII